MPRALIAVGLALLVVAHVPPLLGWAEDRSFAAHMAQHLLVGDLAPLALVVALAPPLPRGAAAAAFPAWAASLAVWHVPAVMEAALHHATVHVAQHVSLFAGGYLLWSAILRPALAVGWRLGAVAAMMASGIALSSVLIWWPRVLYATYTHAHGLWGMSPLTDQRTGGGLMLVENMFVGLGAAAWLILGLLRETPPTQEGQTRRA